MPAPLEYDFRVIGRAIVEREIASLERRFIASAQRLNREMAKLGGGGLGGGNSGRTFGGGLGTDRKFKPDVHSFLAQQRANQRVIDKQSSVQQSLAKQRQREERNVAREASKTLRDERRQVENLNRSRQSLHNQRIREERATRQEQAKTDTEKQRAIDRQSSVQQALARQRRSEARQSASGVAAKVEFVKSTVGGAVGRVAGAIGTVGKYGAAIAGLSAAGVAASSISQASSLDEGARRISIAGRREGQVGVDPASITKMVTNTAIARGLAPEQVMEGLRAYVTATGDIKSAIANKDIFATVAQGGEASFVDIAKMGAAARSGMKIESESDMKQAYATWFEQGREGKFELKDFATEGPEILQAAATAGMRGVKGARDIGTIANIGMLANNSSAENATALRNLFLDIQDKAGGIQKGKYFGGKKVDIYKGGDFKNGMRDANDWIFDLISASGGDIGALGDVMQRRGIKIATPLANAYNEASQAARVGLTGKAADVAGDKAGREAMQKIWDRFNKIPAHYGEVERSADDAMKSVSVQMEIINTRLNDVLASQLFPKLVSMLPEIEKLIPKIGELTASLVNLVSFIAEHPWSSLVTALSVSLLAEIAKAGIGAAITRALTAIISGASGAGGGGLGGIGGLGGGGALGKLPGAAGSAAGGTLAAAANIVARGAIGGAVGAGIGGLINGEKGAETGGWIGAGTMAGSYLGPAGAFMGGALGGLGDQVTSLYREVWGSESEDAKNAQAKAEAIKAGRLNPDGSAITSSKPYSYAEHAAEQERIEFHKQVEAEAAKLAEAMKNASDKINAITPNRSDKPSPIKP